VPDKPTHRVYHGTADDHAGTNARILVMDGGAGPTERQRANVLYQLTPEEPFWWGYGGGSPSRTTRAILNDVLPDIPGGRGLDDLPAGLRHQLSIAFTHDFLAHYHDSAGFWLPAKAIVRWTRGFLAEAAKS
jgi:hypothetical protein